MPEYYTNRNFAGLQEYDRKRCFLSYVNPFNHMRNMICRRGRRSGQAEAFRKPVWCIRKRLPACFFILLLAAVSLAGCADDKETEFFSFAERESTEEETGLQETDGKVLTEAVKTEAADTQKAEKPDEKNAEEDNLPAVLCVIHICGAVNRPGVYELPEDSRIMDAVAAGGGFSSDAAADACNLAAHISDGSRIYIMTKKELEAGMDTSPGGQTAKETKPEGGMIITADETRTEELSDKAVKGPEDESLKVNINTAGAEALMTLPGIGKTRAEAVIAWRNAHGSFQSIEDIMKVSGIKQAAFAKIRDRITV